MLKMNIQFWVPEDYQNSNFPPQNWQFWKGLSRFWELCKGDFRAVVNIVMVGSNLFHKTQVMKFVNARLYLDFQSICHGESSAYMQKALKRFSTTENIKLNLLNFFTITHAFASNPILMKIVMKTSVLSYF